MDIQWNMDRDVVFRRFAYDNIRFFIGFPIFVIYKHPADYPDKYVSRVWALDKPTNMIALADSYEEILEKIPQDRTTRFERTPIDDPCIVESWL